MTLRLHSLQATLASHSTQSPMEPRGEPTLYCGIITRSAGAKNEQSNTLRQTLEFTRGPQRSGWYSAAVYRSAFGT